MDPLNSECSDCESECSYTSVDSSEDIPDSISCTKLPIEDMKDIIVETIRNHQFVIINGQTGCGKTTKLPQYLLKAGLNNKCVIGVTQPRRISAVSMATRVAQEMHCELGCEVGYQIRFDKKLNASTKIKFMTEGVLINECQIDKRLNDYGIIIVDEAHEKSINNAIILGLLKIIAQNRPDIKIVIASATINVKKFSEYFNNAPILNIEGILFPVEIIYLKANVKNYIDEAVRIVKRIHEQNSDGGILVFLPGENEINKCFSELKNIENLVVLPLYGAIGLQAQRKVFKPISSGKRKVVLATNIGETGITIDGIVFVIDSGYFKQTNFVPRLEMDTLEPSFVSKAQADQRKGRAGRTNSGFCYRLYRENRFEHFRDEEEPEMYRCNLSSMFLRLCSMNYNPYNFEFLDIPDQKELDRSKNELIELSLLYTDLKLTVLGKHVSELPMDPKLGKLIITSLHNSSFMDILRIACMIPEDYIFKRPHIKKKKALEKQKTFYNNNGDPFMYLNIYDKWKNCDHQRRWCHKYYINAHVMEFIEMSIKQIQYILEKNELKYIENSSGDENLVKKAFLAIFYKNIVQKSIRLFRFVEVRVPNYSCMYDEEYSLLVAHRVLKTGKKYVFINMKVDLTLVEEFSEELRSIGYEIIDSKIIEIEQ